MDTPFLIYLVYILFYFILLNVHGRGTYVPLRPLIVKEGCGALRSTLGSPSVSALNGEHAVLVRLLNFVGHQSVGRALMKSFQARNFVGQQVGVLGIKLGVALGRFGSRCG